MTRLSLRALLKPYVGDPPAGLYRTKAPDLLIRIAGAAVPHFLSVVTRLGGDAELPELPAAVNRTTMRIADRRTVAADGQVVALTLTPLDEHPLPRWNPGAHIDVHLPSGLTRQYSLCGDPQRRDEYRIAVRHSPEGGGGSIEVHGLTVGAHIEVSDPRNAFMMPVPGSASRTTRLRFIAGGIGITPILPMVRLAERRGTPWTLCYTGRSRAALAFLDELLPYGDKVQLRTDDVHGLPTAEALVDDVDPSTAVYVCGPPPMIDAVLRAIPVDSGVEVHSERFSAAPVVDGAPFELELARSGAVVGVGAEQSALAALRNAVPSVAYSCQQGYCGTCVQRVVSGAVDHRDRLLTAEQRELGQMLVCVSRAEQAGDRLVLDL
ncbi:oxidoreductase [Mycolicibacterium cosmeticum]|uniref:Ferredoxin n=1 Tax=Mycolicibacterium cosmeticum TaxID=258533 RepID=W9ATP7_MYCCO|nr:PDR/VanB family oxidoreductase [Mycolicibacterium cosmeticum]TLH66956.1 oxidoreductase [Mycolicibacterium cosmeticum]CDO05981.1 ferredoxin [Mycolicibacterium cosmeticum]